jgi:TPR repeat protein
MRPFALPLCLAVLVSLAACRQSDSTERQQLAEQAALGDSTAQYNLAVEYWRAHEYGKAAVLWRKAAAQGNVDAKNNLGFLLYFGQGVPEAPKEAVALWHEAADLGHPEANYHLGHAALDGKTMPPDPVEAYARFQAAITLGQASSESADQKVARLAEMDQVNTRSQLTEAERQTAEERGQQYARTKARVRPI